MGWRNQVMGTVAYTQILLVRGINSGSGRCQQSPNARRATRQAEIRRLAKSRLRVRGDGRRGERLDREVIEAGANSGGCLAGGGDGSGTALRKVDQGQGRREEWNVAHTLGQAMI